MASAVKSETLNAQVPPKAPSERNSEVNRQSQTTRAVEVNKLIQSQRVINHGLSVVVEGASNIQNKEHETFITQRGGKM